MIHTSALLHTSAPPGLLTSSPGYRGAVGPHREAAGRRAGEAAARAAGRRREAEGEQDATLATTSG